MRCSNCGHDLRSRSPKAGVISSCPRCGSSVAGAELSFADVDPLPPLQIAPRKSWKSILIEAGIVLLIIGVLVALLTQGVQTVGPGEASRYACQNNLKQLAAALHNYHDAYGMLPAQCITDESGRPMHSWRVAILPFLDQKKLYEAYDFDQPWDSPHNRSVCEVPIDSFFCPKAAGSEESVSSRTSYFVVYGEGTVFGPDRWTKFSGVTDGLSNTIMIVECNSPDFRVKWYEPRDIPFDEMEFTLNPPRGIGVSSAHPGGAHVAFADGSVRAIADNSVGEPTFRYLLIRNDGMPVQVP